MAFELEVPATAKPSSDPFVLISGTGRSGSNRILDVYDASPWTTCRNEVNSIPGGDFAKVGGQLYPQTLGGEQLQKLQQAIMKAPLRRGARDRLSQTDKAFLSRVGRAALPVMSKTQLRRILQKTSAMHSEFEWALPAASINADTLPNAVLILKVNSAPTWATALVQADRNCRIVHNIRDPLAYLQSWYNRLIMNGTGTRSFEDNFGDIPEILSHFGRGDSERLAAPKLENMIEVEMWRWRYTNERLLELASYAGQYLLITYADIEADRAGAAERLFGFAGLAFDANVERRVNALRNVLFAKPHETKLEPSMCEALIGRVLENSPLKGIRLTERRKHGS